MHKCHVCVFFIVAFLWCQSSACLGLHISHTWLTLKVVQVSTYVCFSAACLQVPIAMVTFVDRDRVWIKSVQGLSGLKQVERRKSLCAW